jgi:hypothetical protein
MALARFYPLAGIIFFILGAGCRGPLQDYAHGPGKGRELNIHDYGSALLAIDTADIPSGLDSLAKIYGFFLGSEYRSPENVQRIRNFISDPLIKELGAEVEKVYPDLSFLEEGLGDAFSRMEMAVPGMKAPEVFTYISGLYYEAPVQYYDSVLVIGMDLYLGPEFPPYRAVGLPMYMTRRMEKDNILPDCMREIGMRLAGIGGERRVLLDHMVFFGKALYFLDVTLPDVPGNLKAGFTPGHYEWCEKNEKNIWALMVGDGSLYSSNPSVISKFMQDGPFTSGLPPESPARLGWYVGWQIVRNYMKKNPGVGLQELFNMSDSQEILASSGYKPR